MAYTADMLQNLVSITQFNHGQASRIFDRVHSQRQLIVLKNNQPSAIILSPEEYSRLTEIEEYYFLLLEASERLAANGDTPSIPLQTVLSNLGITKEELENADEVIIE